MRCLLFAPFFVDAQDFRFASKRPRRAAQHAQSASLSNYLSSMSQNRKVGSMIARSCQPGRCAAFPMRLACKKTKLIHFTVLEQPRPGTTLSVETTERSPLVRRRGNCLHEQKMPRQKCIVNLGASLGPLHFQSDGEAMSYLHNFATIDCSL